MNKKWKWIADGYGNPNAEDLHASPNDAIFEVLDSLDAEDWPETITLLAYAPVNIERSDIESLNPLLYVLDMLDQQYADPEALSGFAPTLRMEQAEKEFINIILKEYIPWFQTVAHKKKINVAEWVEKEAKHNISSKKTNGAGAPQNKRTLPPPETLGELQERIVRIVPRTMEMLTGYKFLSKKKQKECVQNTAATIHQHIEKLVSENGSPDHPLPEELPVYVTRMIEIGKTNIQQHLKSS